MTFHGEVDLEALIPDQVGDMPLVLNASVSGQEYVDRASSGEPEVAQLINDLVAELGRSTDDISYVVANGWIEPGHDYFYIRALRVAGAASDALLSGKVDVDLKTIPIFNDGMSGAASPVTIGGKDATLVTSMIGDTVLETTYYYGYGDIVFTVLVSSGHDEIVAEALSLLP